MLDGGRSFIKTSQPSTAPGGLSSAFRVEGIAKGTSQVTPVVFLVDFSDRPSHRSQAEFTSLFFDTGSTSKSVSNYWSEVSYGNLTISGSPSDVVGWLRAGVDFTTSVSNYSSLLDSVTGLNYSNFVTLFTDLISSLDGSVDFSVYDSNGDGVVDSPIFVHPGWGAEDSGDVSNDIYSQTILFSTPISTNDGVRFDDVVIVPEEKFYNDPDFLATGVGVDDGDEDIVGIGVIVHEMGHLMGLPDLYPTGSSGQTSGGFSGVGIYDLMGYGMWGDNLLLDEDTPTHLSAWSKVFLQWVDPVDLSSMPSPYSLEPVEAFPVVYRVMVSSSPAGDKYILIENRQKRDPTEQPFPAWLFDNTLPGTGVLIWFIDEEVINLNLSSNTVNNDPNNKGVDVEEADGENELDQTPQGTTPNDRARFFGELEDFYRDKTQVYSRSDAPINLTNFTVVPKDVTIKGNTYTVNYLVFSSGVEWKTFDIDATQNFTNGPILSNQVNAIGQDSSNAIWFGTDSGISRLAGREFEHFKGIDGLPSENITAFAFDQSTGVMWVGTDSGLVRMRDRGAGFEVVSIYTTTAVPPLNFGLPSNQINDLIIDGNGYVRVATSAGMALVDDNDTDNEADDFVISMLNGKNLTAIALSPGGNINPLYDVIFAADDQGNIYRADESDPRSDADFDVISLPQNPVINDIAIDPRGRIWVATESNGFLVIDDKLTQDLADDEFDPLDVDGDGDTVEAYYVTSSDNLASDRVTGIAFQEVTGLQEPVVLLAHRNDGVNDGGVTKIDLNRSGSERFDPFIGLFVFREDTTPPITDGPASAVIYGAFADSSGNVWFPTDSGASRYGNAGVVSLDSATYFNYTAVATVTLEDDGVNVDPTVPDTVTVFVTSTTDNAGISVTLQETGNDTGIFEGKFGFTQEASGVDANGRGLIQVNHNDTVTVTYHDASPPGDRVATATWKRVYPFKDSIIIEGCFIATAAYGSYASPSVKILRKFRDQILLKTSLGRKIVGAYYKFSPAIARVIRRSGGLRWLVRVALVPVSSFVWVLMVHPWLAFVLVWMALGVSALFRRKGAVTTS